MGKKLPVVIWGHNPNGKLKTTGSVFAAPKLNHELKRKNNLDPRRVKFQIGVLVTRVTFHSCRVDTGCNPPF